MNTKLNTMNGEIIKMWNKKRVSIARRDGNGNDLAVIAEQQTYRYENHPRRADMHFQPHQKGEYERAIRQYERQRADYLAKN